MTTVRLYTTAGCHLCELAQDMLLNLGCEIDYMEIGDDDKLVSQYGVRIPVLKFFDDSELDWPFDQHDIETKLRIQQ